jgi:hypothetical protein
VSLGVQEGVHLIAFLYCHFQMKKKFAPKPSFLFVIPSMSVCECVFPSSGVLPRVVAQDQTSCAAQMLTCWSLRELRKI